MANQQASRSAAAGMNGGEAKLIGTMNSPAVTAQINKNFESVILPLDLIDDNGDNPRGSIDETEPEFVELTASMDDVGLIEPIPVTPLENGRFRAVGGHRRKRSAQKLNWTEIGCTLIENLSPEQEFILMLTENLQRKDLKPSQEARAFGRLEAQGKNVYQIARALNVKKSHVELRLPLLKLLPEIQSMFDDGDLPGGHAKLLAQLPSEKQLQTAVRAQRMTYQKLGKLVGSLLHPELEEDEMPERRRRRSSNYKVLAPDEQFTRSWAISSLNETKIENFTAEQLAHSFDDVCQDACIEEKSELACMGCPVPRLIASLLKRNAVTSPIKAGEQNKESKLENDER